MLVFEGSFVILVSLVFRVLFVFFSLILKFRERFRGVEMCVFR